MGTPWLRFEPGRVPRDVRAAMRLTQALAVMGRRDDAGKPLPFSITFTTLDLSRPNKASRHVTLPKAVRCGASHNLAQHGQVGVKPADGSTPQTAVHLHLIERVNGEQVL